MSTDDPWRTATGLVQNLREADTLGPWDDFAIRYRPFLLIVFRKLGCEVHDAEELANDVLLEFQKGIQSFDYDREKGGLRAFLRRIAQVRTYDHWRRKGSRGGRLLVDPGSDMPDGKLDPFGTLWDSESVRHEILMSIAWLAQNRKLDPPSRSILMECYYQGREDTEVADLLERPVQDVWRVKSRWRSHLADAIRVVRESDEEA